MDSKKHHWDAFYLIMLCLSLLAFLGLLGLMLMEGCYFLRSLHFLRRPRLLRLVVLVLLFQADRLECRLVVWGYQIRMGRTYIMFSE